MIVISVVMISAIIYGAIIESKEKTNSYEKNRKN